ncbi:MAG: thioredoxin domain-containing protein [Deltaproteobacteria bacterium]|nr:thioredoxin domain-containing protein [Deltaproteobacteria bacterium]
MPRFPTVAAFLVCFAACAGGTATENPGSEAQARPPASAPEGAAPGWDTLPPVVATVGGEPITAAALDDELSTELVEMRVKLYEARKNALDQLIYGKLVEAEAKKRGITSDQLIQQEVEAKVAPPSDAEVEAFYGQNAGRIRGSLDEVREPVRQHLQGEKSAELMRGYLQGLEEAAKVERNLKPPRFPVDPGNAPRIGSPKAPVQIVEFSDFECPYCGGAAETVHEIVEKYGDKVSVTFMHFPLPMHANAPKAAEASMCANDQGKFWEYHDQLFANQRMLDPLSLIRFAGEVGLDANAFQTCLDTAKHQAVVEANVETGRKVGMSGTPGFYVNGIHLSGALPIEMFSEVIDAELAGK